MGYFKVHIETWIFHVSKLTIASQKCNHSLKALAPNADLNGGIRMKIWDQEVFKFAKNRFLGKRSKLNYKYSTLSLRRVAFHILRKSLSLSRRYSSLIGKRGFVRMSAACSPVCHFDIRTRFAKWQSRTKWNWRSIMLVALIDQSILRCRNCTRIIISELNAPWFTKWKHISKETR